MTDSRLRAGSQRLQYFSSTHGSLLTRKFQFTNQEKGNIINSWKEENRQKAFETTAVQRPEGKCKNE